jgi:hypothetical protein
MHDEHWLIEGHVHYIGFAGTTNIDELLEIDNRMIAALEASPHPIHFVIDVRGLAAPLGLDQGLKIRHLRHEKTGWIVLIGGSQNSIMRFVISTTFKIFGARYKDCATPEAALEFLKQMEPDLTNIPTQA